MSVPIIASSTKNSTNGTASSLTLTKPTGVESGDLLLLLVGNENSANGEGFDTLTSWNLEFNYGSGGVDTYTGLYSRIATGDPLEDAPIVPFLGADDGFGWYLRVTGVNATNPVRVVGTSLEQVSSSITTLALTTDTNTFSLAISLMSYDGADADPFTESGTGWTLGDWTESPIGSTSGNASSGAYSTKEILTASTTTEDSVITGDGTSDGITASMFIIAGDETVAGLTHWGICSVTGATILLSSAKRDRASSSIATTIAIATVTSSGGITTFGSATMSGTVSAVSVGGTDRFGKLAISSNTVVNSSAILDKNSTSVLNSSINIVILAKRDRASTSTINAATTTISSGNITIFGSVAMSGTVSAVSVGGADRFGKSVVASSVIVTSNSSIDRTSSLSIVSTTGLTISAKLDRNANTSLSATASVTSSGKGDRFANVSLSGVTSVVSVVQEGQIVYGSVFLLVNGTSYRTTNGLTYLTSSGDVYVLKAVVKTLSVDGYIDKFGVAALSSNATIATTPNVDRSATTSIQGTVSAVSVGGTDRLGKVVIASDTVVECVANGLVIETKRPTTSLDTWTFSEKVYDGNLGSISYTIDTTALDIWSGFNGADNLYSELDLYIVYNTNGGSSNSVFNLDYSLDGGDSWEIPLESGAIREIVGNIKAKISLPVGQDLGLIQVRGDFQYIDGSGVFPYLVEIWTEGLYTTLSDSSLSSSTSINAVGIVTSGAVDKFGIASISSTSTVACVGTLSGVQLGSSAITATTSLTATPKSDRFASVIISGTTASVTVGGATRFGKVILASATALVSTSITERNADTTLTASTSVASVPKVDKLSTALISTTTTVLCVGSLSGVQQGVTSLTALVSTTTVGSVDKLSSSTLNAVVSAVTVGGASRFGKAVLTAIATTSPLAIRDRFTSVSLNSTTNTASIGKSDRYGKSQLTATTSINAVGSLDGSVSGSANVSSSTAVNTIGVLTLLGVLTLAAASITNVIPSIDRVTTVSISSIPSTLTIGNINRYSSCLITSNVNVNAIGFTESTLNSSASITAASNVSVVGTKSGIKLGLSSIVSITTTNTKAGLDLAGVTNINSTPSVVTLWSVDKFSLSSLTVLSSLSVNAFVDTSVQGTSNVNPTTNLNVIANLDRYTQVSLNHNTTCNTLLTLDKYTQVSLQGLSTINTIGNLASAKFGKSNLTSNVSLNVTSTVVSVLLQVDLQSESHVSVTGFETLSASCSILSRTNVFIGPILNLKTYVEFIDERIEVEFTDNHIRLDIVDNSIIVEFKD